MSTLDDPGAAYLQALRDAVEQSAGDGELVGRIERLPGGDEAALAFLRDGLPMTFRPEWAAGACGTARFAVQTSGGLHDLCMEIDEHGCRIVDELADPDTFVQIPIAVFLQIAFKQITGGEAYVDGVVQASGDVVLATSLDGWFDAPSADVAKLGR